MKWLAALAVVSLGVLVYRRLGWIRMEAPDCTQRQSIFKSTGVRYRQTHPGDRRRLRMVNPRVHRRIKSA
jgi:hypothetical protein